MRYVLLFRVVFQVCSNLLRFTIFAFHLFPIANLSNPFENDPVVHTNNPLLEDKEVFQFILDFNLALMRHSVCVDNVNVPLL